MVGVSLVDSFEFCSIYISFTISRPAFSKSIANYHRKLTKRFRKLSKKG